MQRQTSRTFPITLLALALAPAACADEDIPEIRSDLARNQHPEIQHDELAQFGEGQAELAITLLRHAGKAGDGNLFLSPYSISTALGMVYAGAAGQTATQMAGALNFTLPEAKIHAGFNAIDLALAERARNASSETIPFRLQTANSIWGQEGMALAPAFLDTLAVNYGAGLRVRDFAGDPEGARETINRWVEDRTRDRIKELLQKGSVTPSTRLVLTNAIYFAAAWAFPFETSETADRPFLAGVEASDSIEVPSLHQRVKHGYTEGSGFRAAELAYDGEQLSMVVIEPDDLAAFEAGLTGMQLQHLVAGLQTRELDLTLPKFKFDAPLPLRPILEELGMTDAFTGSADFSRIDGVGGLFLSDVVHKGFVSIDERGTEAAAATAATFQDSAAPPATLVVDRPFLFLIRDKPTGTILFIGRVVDPR